MRKLEDRINSKLNLQFELYNQGMTLLRDNMSRRFEQQEKQVEQVMQALQLALSAQRQIMEDSLQQHQELTSKSLEELRKAVQEEFVALDARVTRLE